MKYIKIIVLNLNKKRRTEYFFKIPKEKLQPLTAFHYVFVDTSQQAVLAIYQVSQY